MTSLRSLPVLVLGVALAGCPTAPKPDPIPPTPKVVAFTAAPTSVLPGTEVTLTWEVTDATTVTIADVDKGDLSGVDGRLSGEVKVVPTASSLYVLTALNERGAKATAFVSVKVSGADADSLLFAAFPEILAPGQTGTLLWTATGAQAVTITDADGAALDLKGQVESGSVSVTPTLSETTYTLTADGQVRTVTVKRTPAIDVLTVSTPSAAQGAPVTVSWKTTWATRVTLSSPGIGVLAETTTPADVAMGSFTGPVPDLPDGAVLNYVLYAEGPGGAERQTVSVVVGTNPAIREVTAPQYAKVGGDFSLSWKTVNADQVQVLVAGLVVYETSTLAEVLAGSVRLSTPATLTTYTVKAAAVRSGKSATKDVTVDAVGDTRVDTFTVTPDAVTAGGSPVTLTWNVPNARRVRVEQDDALTVVWVEGRAAESGSATAYPNSSITRFRLTADNQLDGPITATAQATVSSVAELASADGGLVFQTVGGSADIVSPIGSELQGLPLNTLEAVSPSTTFVDISATGTRLTFTDQDRGYSTFTAPGFETFLFGTRLGTGTLTASPNGYLSLRLNPLNVGPPTVFPTPNNTDYNNVIGPFYANLELGPVGNVFWEIQGEAPNRVLIVQWDKVRLVGYPYSELTFQLQLTQTGVVTFEYRTLNGLPPSYLLAIGLQTTAGRGMNYNQPPTAPTRVRFFGPATSPVSVPTTRVPVSGFAKIGSGVAPVSLARFLRTGDLSLAEVLYSPSTSVPSGEWIEVRNASTTPVDLNGWQLDFGGPVHTIAGNATVPAGGVLVLGQTVDPMLNDGVTVNYAYGTTFAMNDVTGSVTLRNPNFGATANWTAAGPGGSGVAGVFDQTPVITSDTASVLGPKPCSATRTFGTQTPQQRGTPGVISSCRGYLLQPIQGAFEDISSSTTYVTLQATSVSVQPSAEGLAQLNVSSAPVTLFGTSTNVLTVSSNGWLVPYAYTASGLNPAGSSNKPRPSTDTPASGQIIAPFWDDLEWTGRANAGVYAKRYAAGQSTVDSRAHWIIQWKNVSRWLLSSNNDDMNFEVKLFDSGDLEYHYGTMTSGTSQDYAGGTSATVWLETPAGTEALTWSIDRSSISPNSGLRYLRAP